MKSFIAGNKAVEKNKTKAIINEVIAKTARTISPCVILDGPGMKTLKALKKHKHPSRNIHIPNNSKDFKEISKKHPQTYEMTLYDFLYKHRNRKYKLGLVYMDYMCTFNGNTECNPVNDLKLLFINKMLKFGSILGITLACRNTVKNKTGFTHNTILKVISTIQKFAGQNRYEATLLEDVGGVYFNGGPMFTLLFKVIRK
ncbi:hypothetical protein LCGC14_2311860 [marine sediment metagenome]|uniref:Uncharacterized protein n=1 Tax=marine sediment metagenome TaxID=412755 RepID=A0A0F9D7Z2_9ZZZZ